MRRRIYSDGWIRKGYSEVFVLLGLNWREVHQEYRELELKRPEWLLGYDVLLATPDNYRALEGLRVHEFRVTGMAYKHPKFTYAVEILERSRIFSSYYKNGER